MKRILSLAICFILTLALFSGCAKANNEASTNQGTGVFSVGFAQANITPNMNVYLGGFFDPNERLSNEILDPIYATCVAFTDAKGNSALLFCMDLLNTNETIFKPLREEISAETGVPFTNILFTSSHTHSAPHQANAQNVQSNLLIMDSCKQIAKDALADCKPAQMYGTFIRPEGLNFVRHYVLSDGTYLGKGIGYFPKDQLIGHHHKADNLLQMVKFTREGGKDVIITNWQAHYRSATEINYNGISADYPGIYRKTLEDTLDCHAAFVLGGSGNLNSTSHINGLTTSVDYKEHGRMLAAHAAEAAKNFQPIDLGDIYVKENLFQLEGDSRVLPLYTLGFGDFACAFAPFEIFDTNAKGVREDSKWTYTFYASCSNAGTGNGYLPDAEAFTYSCYEAYGQADKNAPYETYKEINYASRYTKFPDGTAEIIQEQLTTMLNDMFSESGNTQKERAQGYMSEEFVPVTDGKVYTNPNPGDASKVTEGKNGLYCMTLVADGSKFKNVLILNKDLADQIVQKESMKLLFDERTVIVGFAE